MDELQPCQALTVVRNQSLLLFLKRIVLGSCHENDLLL